MGLYQWKTSSNLFVVLLLRFISIYDYKAPGRVTKLLWLPVASVVNPCVADYPDAVSFVFVC